MIRLPLTFSLSLFVCSGLISCVAFAQVQAQEIEPCGELQSSPKKPVLRRIAPTIESPPATQSTPETNTKAKPSCNRQDTQVSNGARIHIEFEGLHELTVADVLKAFRDEAVALAEDTMPNDKMLDRASNVLRDLLRNRGHMDASVTATRFFETQTVRFLIEEGTQYEIGALSFEGNKRFSSEELEVPLRQCLQRHSKDGRLDYHRDVFDYCHRSLLVFIRSKGFLQAKYQEPTILTSGTGLNITIPIDEGPLYRLGAIRIEGADAFSTDEVKALFSVARDEVADGDNISKWLFEDLRAAYGEKGFIQYTAEPVPTFRDNPTNKNEGIVDLDVTLDEGKRFKVHSITFSGDALPENEMTSFLLLRVGDYYSDSLFTESVARLNKTGMFEPIDKDKDVNLRTNDEEASVAIVLTLRKKGAQVPSHLIPK